LDRPTVALAPLILLLLPGVLPAQSFQDSVSEQRYLEPMTTDLTKETAPRMTFNLLNDIPLPGPLTGRGPRLVDGEIEIPVAGGVAVSGWLGEEVPRILPYPPGDETGPRAWSYSPNGDFRCRILESGHILAQKSCNRCSKGWHKKWKLRIAGNDIAPPLLTDNRVFYGGLDNRVYCLKRRNGHRLWESDAPGRVSQRLARWRLSGAPEGEGTAELIILIPDSGKEIIALDARTGGRIATFDIPQNGGKLKGSPLVTTDGKIVVARQRYASAQASLMVFDLVAPGETAISGRASEPDRR
jgi:hypothetical protein